jgi:hypothetical protein
MIDINKTNAMAEFKIRTTSRKLLADIITPVSE